MKIIEWKIAVDILISLKQMHSFCITPWWWHQQWFAKYVLGRINLGLWDWISLARPGPQILIYIIYIH